MASPIDMTSIFNYEGININKWFRKTLLARHVDGSNFANIIIDTANLDACIDGERRLEKDEVGIIVLEVLNRDPNIGNTYL